ncbi:unnamed protein product, partial [Meganyctiphanes norvegica]
QPSEENFQPRILKLVKEGGRLGFSIIQNTDSNDPIIISTISPGTTAHSHAGLEPKDRLLSINGVSMDGQDVSNAAHLLWDLTGEVILEVKYTPGDALEACKSGGHPNWQC